MQWSVLRCQLSPKANSYIPSVSVGFDMVCASLLLFLYKTLAYSTDEFYLAQHPKVDQFSLNVAFKRLQQNCSEAQEQFYPVDL